MATNDIKEIDLAAAKKAVQKCFVRLTEGLSLTTGNFGPMLVQEGYMTQHDLEYCRKMKAEEISYFIDNHVTIKLMKWNTLIKCLKKTNQDIGDILQKEYEKHSATSSVNLNFVSVGVPAFSTGRYLARSDVETLVKDEIRKTAETPEDGLLVITGEGGVGKTDLLSKLLKDGNNKKFFVDDCKVNRVFFVKCWKWRKVFDREEFEKDIVNLAKTMERNENMFVNFKSVIWHYQREQLSCAFVFDDLFNYKVIESFLEMTNDAGGGDPICFAVTRNSQQILEESELCPKSFVRDSVRIPEFTSSDILTLWKEIFKISNLLSDDELKILESMCCGLPLIASLIAARFRKWKNRTQVVDQFKQLMSMKKDIGQLRINNRSFETVSKLVSFSLDQMDPILRMQYYAFLLFNPSDPVSIFDLRVVWQLNLAGDSLIDVRNICKAFDEQCLLRIINHEKASEGRKEGQSLLFDGDNEDQFVIHQLLYDSAVRKVSEDLKCPKLQLTEITYKLVSGEINRETLKVSSDVADTKEQDDETDNAKLAILFEAFKFSRMKLLRQIIERLSIKDVAFFSRRKSLELTKNEPFILFLYNYEYVAIADKSGPIKSNDCKFWDWRMKRRWRQVASISITESDKLVFRIVERLKEENCELLWWVITETGLADNEGIPQCLAFRFDRFDGVSDVRLFEMLKPWQIQIDNYEEELRMKCYGKSDHFVQAVVQQNLEEVERILMTRNPSMWSILSALYVAFYKGYRNIAEETFKNNPNALNHLLFMDIVCIKDYVEVAAQFGQLEMLKFLKEQNSEKLQSIEAVLRASERGHLECVKLFHEVFPGCLRLKGVSRGSTPLMEAGKWGQQAVFEYILEQDSKTLDDVDGFKIGVGHYIVMSDNIEMIKLAATKVKSLKKHKEMMNSACLLGNMSCVEYLAENFPKVMEHGSFMEQTPIPAAVLSRKLEVIDFLFDKSDFIDQVKSLAGAIAFQYPEIVWFLVLKNPNLPDKTMLTFAKKIGNGDIIKILDNSLLYADNNKELKILETLKIPFKGGVTEFLENCLQESDGYFKMAIQFLLGYMKETGTEITNLFENWETFLNHSLKFTSDNSKTAWDTLEEMD